MSKGISVHHVCSGFGPYVTEWQSLYEAQFGTLQETVLPTRLYVIRYMYMYGMMTLTVM